MAVGVGADLYRVLSGACWTAAPLRLPTFGADAVLVSLFETLPDFRGVPGQRLGGRADIDRGAPWAGPDIRWKPWSRTRPARSAASWTAAEPNRRG